MRNHPLDLTVAKLASKAGVGEGIFSTGKKLLEGAVSSARKGWGVGAKRIAQESSAGAHLAKGESKGFNNMRRSLVSKRYNKSRNSLDTIGQMTATARSNPLKSGLGAAALTGVAANAVIPASSHPRGAIGHARAGNYISAAANAASGRIF